MQVVKIHDCVGCHNKGEPKLLTEYELENLSEDKSIAFSVIVFKEEKDKVFSDDMEEAATDFVIENPIVSQLWVFLILCFVLPVHS